MSWEDDPAVDRKMIHSQSSFGEDDPVVDPQTIPRQAAKAPESLPPPPELTQDRSTMWDTAKDWIGDAAKRTIQLPARFAQTFTPRVEAPKDGEVKSGMGAAFTRGLGEHRNDMDMATEINWKNPEGWEAAKQRYYQEKDQWDKTRPRTNGTGLLGKAKGVLEDTSGTIGPMFVSFLMDVPTGERPGLSMAYWQQQGRGAMLGAGLSGIDTTRLDDQQRYAIDTGASAAGTVYAISEQLNRFRGGKDIRRALSKAKEEGWGKKYVKGVAGESLEEGFQQTIQDIYVNYVRAVADPALPEAQRQKAISSMEMLTNFGKTTAQSIPTMALLGAGNAALDAVQKKLIPDRKPVTAPQVDEWAAKNPDKAAKLAAIEEPSRGEWESTGLPRASREERMMVSKYLNMREPVAPASTPPAQTAAQPPPVSAPAQTQPPAPVPAAATPPPIPPQAQAQTAAQAEPQTQADLDLVDVPVSQIRDAEIVLRPKLMQFKQIENDATGESATHKETIGGKWDDVKAGNMLLWEPNDPSAHGLTAGQKYIVADGHGRVNYGRRAGREAYNAQILREADGVTAQDAMILAAEKNIADGKGTVHDHARFTRNVRATLGTDKAIARAKEAGIDRRQGATIGLSSSDALFEAFVNEVVTPDQAESIAATAPRNEAMQRAGIQAARKGMKSELIPHFIRALQAHTGQQSPTSSQLDMFGSDDSAMKSMEEQAKRAAAIVRGIQEQVTAVQSAAKRPDVAKKMGVDVSDPEGVRKKVDSLKAELIRWENWALHPDLVAQVKGGDAAAIVPPAKPVEPAQAPAKPPKNKGLKEEKGTSPSEKEQVVPPVPDAKKPDKALIIPTRAANGGVAIEVQPVVEAKKPEPPPSDHSAVYREIFETANRYAAIPESERTPQQLKYLLAMGRIGRDGGTSEDRATISNGISDDASALIPSDLVDQDENDSFWKGLSKPPPEPKVGTKGNTMAPNVPAVELVNRLEKRIEAEGPLSWSELFQIADEVYGGTQAQGKYQSKDATDALETAINRYLIGFRMGANASEAKQDVASLEKIVDRMPTQTRRDAESELLQQFSTPPQYAYIVAWAANIGRNDVVIEPSAGNGGIAVHAANAKPKELYVNEMSRRRIQNLKSLGIAKTVFTEDAEQLNNVMPEEVKPTVVGMNPPFSSAERLKGKKDTAIGANHIETALKRLEPGGRLVAIVGRGMAMDAPTFRSWWGKIKGEYNVRANVEVAGEIYRKYGTTFATRLLVIDKTGPTVQDVVTGEVNSLSDLIDKLEGVRNERVERVGASGKEAASGTRPGTGQGRGNDGSTGAVGSGESGDGRPPRGKNEGSTGDSESKDAGEGTGVGGGGRRNGPRGTGGNGTGGSRGGVRGKDQDANVSGGASGRSESVAAKPEEVVGKSPENIPTADGSNRPATPAEIEIQAASETPTPEVGEGSVFEHYKPALTITGAKPHPAPLVESAAMASVKSPNVDYRPKISQATIESGMPSSAQLESIIYAGASHQKMIPVTEADREVYRKAYPGREVPTEKRKGYFEGGGTGYGKGMVAAGVILDNWNQGRKKSIWVSEKWKLADDAKRDWTDLGGKENDVVVQKPIKSGDNIKAASGILFTTYDTMGRKQDGIAARIEQIVSWVGPDFDGAILFDEAHNMANAIEMKGKRGKKKIAAKALMGVELQRRLPNARVVYLSATGATEVSNLAYADRLGLWGEGTSFSNREDFISKVSQGGLAAMELVARDMKSLGLYNARTLSFEGVGYDRITHKLSDHQVDDYNAMAEAWQIVFDDIHKALGITAAKVMKDGEPKVDTKIKGQIMGQFWGAELRFFNQIVTSMQMPSVIDKMEKDLANGDAAVIQLVNTLEATTERKLNDVENLEDIEDFDMTPREVIIDFVRGSFPVAQYRPVVDADGNVGMELVLDSQGRPVENKDAVAMRDALIERLGSIRVPEGPLDMLVNHFGAEAVAEVTGRKRRVLRGKDGTTKVDKRPANVNKAEISAFQDDRKKIIIFSQAGGTGASYHASLKAKNQRPRQHFLVQAGWIASQAVQGLGRTHRSNQKQPPFYHLCETDLPGHRRFISTIARRLDQLGALSKGSRKAGGGGLFSETDNLEGSHAYDALQRMLDDIVMGSVEGVSVSDFEGQTGLRLTKDNGSPIESPIEITQFLNRMLAMNVDMQNKVFGAFEERLKANIELAVQTGELDVGMEDVRAKRIEKVSEEVVFTDKDSGAVTKHIHLNVWNATRKVHWDVVKNSTLFAYNRQSKRIYAIMPHSDTTDAKTGRIVKTYWKVGPSSKVVIKADDIRGENWERHDDKDDAEVRWLQEYDALPEMQSEPLHMIAGAVLPIWNRLSGRPSVRRATTDKGERILGRIIPNSELGATMQRLGVGMKTPKWTGAEALENVSENGTLIHLANKWIIKRSKVAGENRVELEGWQFADLNELRPIGVFTETHQYKTRAFIPLSTAGATTLDRIMRSNPIAEVVYPDSKGGHPTGGLGVGAAAAAGAEFFPGSSTKNEYVDEMRSRLGYSKLTAPEAHKWDMAMAEAAEIMAKDPYAGESLVQSLKEKPRPLSDTENMVMLRHLIATEKIRNEAASESAKLSYNPDASEVEKARAVAASSAAEARLDEVYEVNRKIAGSEAGRALAARKAFADEEYTLVSMRNQKIVANGGKPLTPEQAEQVRKIYAELENLKKKLSEAEGNPKKIAKFLNELAGAKERWREILRRDRRSAKTFLDLAREYAKENGLEIDEDTFKRLKDKLDAASAMTDKAQRNKAIADAVQEFADIAPIQGGSWFDAYIYSNMLSSPTSHMRNTLGNATNVLGLRPLTLLAQKDFKGADKFFRGAWAEVFNGGAWQAAVESFRTGEMSKWMETIDDPTMNVYAAAKRLKGPENKVGRGVWKSLTAIGRLMQAQDVYFGRMIEMGESKRLMDQGVPVETAISQGKTLAAKYLYRDRLKRPDESFDPAARAIEHLGLWMDGIRKSEMKILKYPAKMTIPFLKTPVKIAQFNVQVSPLGFMGMNKDRIAQAHYGQTFKEMATEAEKLAGSSDPEDINHLEEIQAHMDEVRKTSLERMAAASVGSMLMVLGAIATITNNTIWEAPDDPDEKKLFYDAGYRPYSFRVGNRWIPMMYLGPGMLAFALPAALKHSMEGNPGNHDGAFEKVGRVLGAIPKMIVDQLPLEGMASIMGALTGRSDYTWKRTMAGYVRQVVPAAGLLQWIKQIVDPVYRKAVTVGETVAAGIPGLSDHVKAVTNSQGLPAEASLWQAFQPYKVGVHDEEKAEKFAKLLVAKALYRATDPDATEDEREAAKKVFKKSGVSQVEAVELLRDHVGREVTRKGKITRGHTVQHDKQGHLTTYGLRVRRLQGLFD